uniref:hypothetical protein n=1 Tax=Streptomyces sp. CA-136453 TaxID=3240050 RepID=UPI003F49827E
MTGRDWRNMRRADFDAAAPLVLDAPVASAGSAVPAAPDAYGTLALFGAPPPKPPRPKRRPAAPVDQAPLF